MPDVWFPYLGIEIEHLSKIAFTIFGISVAWYGVIIALGVVCGYLLARHLAKKSGQDPETYLDFLIYALIFGIIGARLYYVIFSWDLYKDNLWSIFDLRSGGLAIYGTTIASVITAIIFCRVKKIPVMELLDTIMPCLALGQAIGRWGNFFNQEAFGGYTDSIFAMRLNVKTAAYTTTELTQQAVSKGGVTYIQVHPTFLYESFWCLMLVILLVAISKRKKFHGQILYLYMIGYGIGRAFIETLRTDQLLLWNTDIPVSALLSVLAALAGLVCLILGFRKSKLQAEKVSEEDNEFAPKIETEDF